MVPMQQQDMAEGRKELLGVALVSGFHHSLQPFLLNGQILCEQVPIGKGVNLLET